jgi:hypothetical protein
VVGKYVCEFGSFLEESRALYKHFKLFLQEERKCRNGYCDENY